MSTPARSTGIANVMFGQSAGLVAARLAYIERHGARFLFNNEPPPAPGYPRMRRGRIVT